MNIIKSFVEKLSEDKLVYLYDRLGDNLQNDLADVFNFIHYEHKDVDKLFSSVKNVDELYSILDTIDSCVNREIIRRKIVITI